MLFLEILMLERLVHFSFINRFMPYFPRFLSPEYDNIYEDLFITIIGLSSWKFGCTSPRLAALIFASWAFLQRESSRVRL